MDNFCKGHLLVPSKRARTHRSASAFNSVIFDLNPASVRFEKGAAATIAINDEIFITGKVESMTQVVIVRAGFSLLTSAKVLTQCKSGLLKKTNGST
jgi:hypothetical protein